MSQPLDRYISDIDSALRSMNSMNFKPPRIFHNGLVRGILAKGGKKEFIKFVRDGDPIDEVVLFRVDPTNKILRRKDGKEGIYDYLIQSENKRKRNRRMGAADPVPIVRIPRKAYLKIHEKALSGRRSDDVFSPLDKYVRSGTLTVGNTTNTSTVVGTLSHLSESNTIIKVLTSKFEHDHEMLLLLEALKNGSVIVEESESDASVGPSRRAKGMFAEDFPPELIISLLEEIDSLWGLSDFKEEFESMKREFIQVSREIEVLEEKVRQGERELEETKGFLGNMQRAQFQADSLATGNEGGGVVGLIESTKQDIAELEERIMSLQRMKEMRGTRDETVT